MFWGFWSIEIVGRGGCKSRIVVLVLDECCDVIYGFNRSAQNIYVRCRHIYRIVGKSILDILPYLLQLDVHCFSSIEYRSAIQGSDTRIVWKKVFNTVSESWGETVAAVLKS